jgi:mono/diheme cytochrome c family protein
MAQAERALAATRVAIGLCLLIGAACGPKQNAPTASVAVIERGSYLANSVGRCFWCHSPQTTTDPALPIPEQLGAGAVIDDKNHVVAPNLTPDPETGIGRWTDAQIVRAIREGLSLEGRRLRGDHPANHFSIMTDDDAAAVVAYLRSLRAIRNELPKNAPYVSDDESVQPFVQPAKDAGRTPEARGAYLVHLGECVGCHTPTTAQKKPFREMKFGGGRRFIETRQGFGYEVPSDPAFDAAADPSLGTGERIVTSDPSGIPHDTPEVFIQTIRSGKVAGVRPLSNAMPWYFFRNLTDDDLRAVFAYLQSVPPVIHNVSNSDPPTLCPICGRYHGRGDTNVVHQ